MTDETYAEWEEAFAAILAGGRRVVLLGGTDVGKTTFTRLLVNRAAEAGQRGAVLDADLGQSEIGPPACVGLAYVSKAVRTLSELPAHALAFVGSTSPVGYLLEHAAAVQKLVRLADAELLVVDTSGYIEGAGARRLNQAECELIAPTHIVALQRDGELDPILAPARRWSGCRVITPAIPAVITRKPPTIRTQRRAMRFAAYFENAALHTFAFGDAAFVGTWLGNGTPLAAHLHKYTAQSLSALTRVYYAEMSGRHLGIMVNHALSPHAPEIGQVMEQLRAKAVTITVAPRLKHLLVGLESAHGKMLGLGLVEALDFRRRTLGILTPVRTPAAACILRFGSLRVTHEGREVGTVAPGDL